MQVYRHGSPMNSVAYTAVTVGVSVCVVSAVNTEQNNYNVKINSATLNRLNQASKRTMPTPRA